MNGWMNEKLRKIIKKKKTKDCSFNILITQL